MRQLVRYFHLRGNPSHRQFQVRQGVPGMGIAAMLADNDIGCKRQDEGRKKGIHHLDIGLIFCEGLQGKIDGVTAS